MCPVTQAVLYSENEQASIEYVPVKLHTLVVSLENQSKEGVCTSNGFFQLAVPHAILTPFMMNFR